MKTKTKDLYGAFKIKMSMLILKLDKLFRDANEEPVFEEVDLDYPDKIKDKNLYSDLAVWLFEFRWFEDTYNGNVPALLEFCIKKDEAINSTGSHHSKEEKRRYRCCHSIIVSAYHLGLFSTETSNNFIILIKEMAQSEKVYKDVDSFKDLITEYENCCNN